MKSGPECQKKGWRSGGQWSHLLGRIGDLRVTVLEELLEVKVHEVCVGRDRRGTYTVMTRDKGQTLVFKCVGETTVPKEYRKTERVKMK